MTSPDTVAGKKVISQAERSLKFYRVMALITGVMLLILCFEMLLKYALDSPLVKYLLWVPIAHGWIYVVYLVTSVILWYRMRWQAGRLVVLVLAGVVPVLSFFVERKVTKEAKLRITAASELVQ